MKDIVTRPTVTSSYKPNKNLIYFVLVVINKVTSYLIYLTNISLKILQNAVTKECLLRRINPHCFPPFITERELKSVGKKTVKIQKYLVDVAINNRGIIATKENINRREAGCCWSVVKVDRFYSHLAVQLVVVIQEFHPNHGRLLVVTEHSLFRV